MRPGNSPYTIIRRLGSGGMADVFLARDTSRDGRLVALKRIRGSSPELLIHFTREARIGALLTHPHVVRVEDAGQDEDGPFIALEFVEGVSASALLRYFAQQRTAVPLEPWFVLARDMAEGLHYAHSLRLKDGARGVLHRDLSLDNVLVSLEGMAKLGDFGLAYMAGDTRLTQTGNVKGKVSYLAPELFESGDYSVASDVYALGIMLFRLGAGMLPFRGNNEGELIRNILHGERPSLAPLRPDLPGPLASWVQQAISLRAEERPRLEALLKLLPTYDVSAASRVALGRAVVAAREQSASQPPSPWAQEALSRSELSDPPKAHAESTERLPSAAVEPLGESVAATDPAQPAVSEPLGVSVAPTERLPSTLTTPRRADTESTVRLPSLLPPQPGVGAEPAEPLPPVPPRSRGASAESTERFASARTEPRKAGDEPTEPRPQVRLEPLKTSDVPTEPVRQALPGPVSPHDAPTPLALTPLPLRSRGRSWRTPLWILLGALALGLLGALAVGAW